MKILNDAGLVHQVFIIKSLFGEEAAARVAKDAQIDADIASLRNLISLIPKFDVKVVQSLPLQDISSTTIYLIHEDGSYGNLYTEYIWIDDKWETLGQANIQLELITNAQIDAIIAGV